jgi:transmembrane sensor
MDNHDFIKDWMEGKISREELEKRKSKGDPDIEQFEAIITRSGALKTPDKLTKEQAWEKLRSKLTEEPRQEAKVVKMNRWIPIGIAASISLVVISFFFLFTDSAVSTSLAETKVFVLPDGSEVFLNADSEISFNKIFWESDRHVLLKGEAFFEVKKGSTFTVETNDGTVTVLGTSFNVNARPTLFEVACFTGRVKVASGPHGVILTKGQFTKLEGNKLSEAAGLDNTKATWRSGDFYFEQKPLYVVIDELERQFNVEIVFKGDDTRLYTGYFNTKNLDEALTMVFKPMGLVHQVESNKKIVVQ